MSWSPSRFVVCGTYVHALNVDELTDVVAHTVQQSAKRVFGNHNLHSLYLYFTDGRMKEFYRFVADYVHVDGMSLVVLGRLCGVPIRREHRVTYVDWIDLLMRRAHRDGWRVFYVGSKPGVAERGAAILRCRFPGLAIETMHGYFEPKAGTADTGEVLTRIRRYRPNLLLVGMGMPRQEHWVLDNLDQIDANAILMSGAAMDYIAGAVRTPPRWAGRCGLEWFFRLCHEPKRLWRRYLLEPWVVGWMMLRSRQTNHVGRSPAIRPANREAQGDD